MAKLLPSCILLLSFSTIHSAQAQTGYYSDPAYSGGIATLNSAPPSQRPYFLTPGPNSFYVSTYYPGVGPYLFPSSCNGQITTQFVWHGTNNNAPNQVIVRQRCGADWASYSNFGKCDNGLGDPVQITLASSRSVSFGGSYVNYGLSDGTHYSIVSPDPNGNIKLYCTPTASSDLNAYVGYAAAVYPIAINLTNTTLANGVQEALTGQQIGATLSLTGLGSPYKVTGLIWSTSGATGSNPIKNWDPNAPGDGNATQIIPLTSSDYSPTNAAAPFNFYDSNPDTVTVKCTGTVTFPDGTSGSFSAVSPAVTFIKPTVSLWNVNTPGAYASSGFSSGLPSGPFSAQEVWDSMTVAVPSPFNQGSQGQACIAQIINVDRAWYRNVKPGPVINPNAVQENAEAIGTNAVQLSPVSLYPSAYKSLQVIGPNNVVSYVINPTALDGAFPYPFGYDAITGKGVSTGYIWQVGNLGYSGDHPTQPYTLNIDDGGGNLWYDSVANDSFTSWMMYQPPGNNSIWVPLQNLTWRWGGVANLVKGNWSVTQTPIFFSSAGLDTTTYPSWSQTLPLGFTVQP